MEEKDKNLEKLFLKKEVDIGALIKILTPYLRIDPEKKQIFLLPDFSKLKYKDGVIIVLLGMKILKEKGMRERELVGPTEIRRISNINLSTVKNALRELEKERIAISEKGKYMVPKFVLEVLKNRFDNLQLKKPRTLKPQKRKRVYKDFSRIKGIFELKPNEFAGELYNFLIKKKGEYLKKALIVIKLTKEKCGIDGLTAAEITRILREHLRVPKIHHPNITTALGGRSASEYVFKQPTKSKKIYLYKLTKTGEDFVNNINFQSGEK